MKKSQVVNTQFWEDSYILDLDPLEKVLFLYLLTNSANNIAGIYEIHIRKIAFETGLDKDMVPKLLKRFEEEGKVYYYDGWIIISNFIKYQPLGAKIEQGIRTIHNALPKDIQQRCDEIWSERGITRLVGMEPTKKEKTVIKPEKQNVKDPKLNTTELDNMLLDLNSKLGGNYKIKTTSDRRNKLRQRLKEFSYEELLIAAQHLAIDDFMQGQNERNTRYGTIDYLIRNNGNVLKYLERETPKKKVSMF